MPGTEALAGWTDAAHHENVYPLAHAHTQRAAHRAEADAIRRQSAEPEERQVADRFHARQQIANRPAGQAAAQEPLTEVRSGGISEDAKEHPANQAAKRSENGIEIDAD